MNRPRPADPIFYRWHWWMVVRCATPGCFNSLSAPVSAWAQWALAPRDHSINSLMERLICTECCRRYPRVEVVEADQVRQLQAWWRRFESSLARQGPEEVTVADDLQDRFRAGVEEETWHHSSMAKFMAEQPQQVERVLAAVKGNWQHLADALAVAGLTDQERKPPTAEVAREAWKRVEARRRVGMALRRPKA